MDGFSRSLLSSSVQRVQQSEQAFGRHCLCFGYLIFVIIYRNGLIVETQQILYKTVSPEVGNGFPILQSHPPCGHRRLSRRRFACSLVSVGPNSNRAGLNAAGSETNAAEASTQREGSLVLSMLCHGAIDVIIETWKHQFEMFHSDNLATSSVMNTDWLIWLI